MVDRRAVSSSPANVARYSGWFCRQAAGQAVPLRFEDWRQAAGGGETVAVVAASVPPAFRGRADAAQLPSWSFCGSRGVRHSPTSLPPSTHVWRDHGSGDNHAALHPYRSAQSMSRRSMQAVPMRCSQTWSTCTAG